jgi:hypothetical protein
MGLMLKLSMLSKSAWSPGLLPFTASSDATSAQHPDGVGGRVAKRKRRVGGIHGQDGVGIGGEEGTGLRLPQHGLIQEFFAAGRRQCQRRQKPRAAGWNFMIVCLQ